MIYVDAPVWTKPVAKPKQRYAHMATDGSPEELHAFAQRIEAKRHFAHRSRSGILHYDINPEQHAKALSAGAVQVSTAELIRRVKL